MLRNLVLLVACALALTGVRTARPDTSPIPQASYTVAGSWRLGGNGGWDYLALEASGGRLFVSRDDHVDVIGPLASDRPLDPRVKLNRPKVDEEIELEAQAKKDLPSVPVVGHTGIADGADTPRSALTRRTGP